jgi:uncharacterized protein
MADETQGNASPEVPAGGPPSKDARTMAMLAHMLGIVGFLGPLIIWLIKKDDEPFVDDQGKEALNFQITVIFAYLATFVLSCVTLGFGSPLLFGVVVANIVFSIIAGLKANEGEAYRYPLVLRLIK